MKLDKLEMVTAMQRIILNKSPKNNGPNICPV